MELGVQGGAFHSCSERSAVQPGERQMAYVGSSDVNQFFLSNLGLSARAALGWNILESSDPFGRVPAL